MDNPFLLRVAQTISNHSLLPPASACGEAVLVALSGGADSVALLRALLELGYRCEAAHCNFHLRGQESDRDEAFVCDLCQRLGVKLHTADFHTADYARKRGISIEMAAREQRYAFFRQLVADNHYAAVAVAHHRDDNAETVLLNIIRGTGLQGLTGMPYRNNDIVRPLLDTGRQDIADYLHRLGQDYVTDSTNLTPDVKRNAVRLKLMPLLRELNPAITDTLLQNAAIARDAQQFIASHAYNIDKVEQPDGSIAIRKQDIGRQVLLFELLHPLGFTPAQIHDIWQGLDEQPGAVFRSPTHELLRDRETIIIRRLEKADEWPEVAFKAGEDATLCGQRLSTRIVSAAEVSEISTDPHKACLDADKVGSRLCLRLSRQGDRFIPYGSRGSKLVSRYMIDHKFSAFQKERQLVLTNGADIVWLVGQRTDDRYKVVKETKNILIAEVFAQSN
ncbi:MAG: tRNA lysidine(34) synthetase TilS [Bacteroidaceae bacterium]|nr:tRNA lysidine(34) synthetase TilS [Bacteroidaceae bacterium]